MLKTVSKKVAARTSAKAAMLSAKRERAIVAHADAIAFCEAEGITGNARKGLVASASTAMHADSARGKIAHAVLVAGVSADYSFADVAKAAKVSRADVNRANLFYIARNVAFRRDLVGFVVSFDMPSETISVRVYRAEAAKAPRKAAKAAPVAAEVSGPDAA
jgi:hypothetical protein